MRALVIGAGEVGRALAEVLSCELRDVEPLETKVSIVHICFPYSESFVSQVIGYIDQYRPLLVVIHSTVPPGTTDTINKTWRADIAVHSPVIGRHPDITEALKRFTKMIGGSVRLSWLAQNHFSSAGIKTEHLGKSVVTELGKLLDTTYYGLCLVWHQEIARVCETYKVPFGAIQQYNRNYNAGYPDGLQRPVLDAMAFKGHCVESNLEMLRKHHDSPLLASMDESNKRWQDETS